VKKEKIQKIKDSILKDPLLYAVIKAYTIDCYNNHALFTEYFTINTKTSVSRKIGVILQEINNIKNLRMQIASNIGHDEVDLIA
jgi:hypothetical protein